MIADHILYLKNVVEEQMTAQDGATRVFDGKFFEVYPPVSAIVKSVPCACLRHHPQRAKKNGTIDSTSATATSVTRVRKLYDVTHLYQVDFYTRDIYDLIPKSAAYMAWLDQFFDFVANNGNFTGTNGENIIAECGVGGILDSEDLMVDGIYKAFCQTQFTDGIYESITIPRITGVTLNEGEIKNG